MSVQSEIDRIITAVGNAYSKVSEKGGTVPASQTVANLATAIGSIPAGSTPSLQSKSVTYTSNGTATITPDEGYDALKKVDVTVNVATCDSPTQFFLDHGYIPYVEFPNEAYRQELMNTVEDFTKYTVGVMCDSYDVERPYNVDICFDPISGSPAIIIS